MIHLGSYIKRLLVIVFFLGLLFSALIIYQNYLIKIFTTPNAFLGLTSSLEELYLNSLFVLLTVILVLISYIFYLLVMYRFHSKGSTSTGPAILPLEAFIEVYESAPVPYITLDEKAQIHNPNKATLRFFGVYPEEIEEKNLFSYISGEYKDQAEKLYQYYQDRIPINRKNVQMVTKKGEIKSVELSVFEMQGSDAFTRVGLAMIFDVTEQKATDKAKTEFLSLASHQLKSPLASMKWITELLSSNGFDPLTDKQKEYVERLHIVNEEMIDLVDVLLNVSRIEMGSLKTDLKLANIQEVSDSVLQELSYMVNKKNIIVKKEYNNFFQNVKTDPKLIRVVIHNLISNALKYTPVGGEVRVTFNQTMFNKTITVSDNGIGIPKSQQNSIFSKQFRADNAKAAADVSGTGLGLYLIKSVVDLLGGEISFLSEENKGSVFTVKF